MNSKVKHSVSGYADTPQQQNFQFHFKVANKLAAHAFLARAAKKNWKIRAAFHNTRCNGVRISSTRIQ